MEDDKLTIQPIHAAICVAAYNALVEVLGPNLAAESVIARTGDIEAAKIEAETRFMFPSALRNVSVEDAIGDLVTA
jgi:hypothetical protein